MTRKENWFFTRGFWDDFCKKIGRFECKKCEFSTGSENFEDKFVKKMLNFAGDLPKF